MFPFYCSKLIDYIETSLSYLLFNIHANTENKIKVCVFILTLHIFMCRCVQIHEWKLQQLQLTVNVQVAFLSIVDLLRQGIICAAILSVS